MIGIYDVAYDGMFYITRCPICNKKGFSYIDQTVKDLVHKYSEADEVRIFSLTGSKKKYFHFELNLSNNWKFIFKFPPDILIL